MNFWNVLNTAPGGAVTGVMATALYFGIRDWLRNRQNMALTIVDGKACYASGGTSFLNDDSGSERWLYVDLQPEGHVPDDTADDYGQPIDRTVKTEDTTLFIRVDLLLQNRSWRDDALTTCRLVLSTKGRKVPNAAAFLGLDRQFYGVNVPAHHLRDLHLLFRFPGAEFRSIPEWRYDQNTTFTLEAKSIRDHEFKETIHPAAFTVAAEVGNAVTFVEA